MRMNNIIITNNEPEEITVTQNENQTIIIDGGGNVIGITDVLVNGVSVVSGNKAYIIVPTKTSELTNDSGFITAETDPTVPTVVKNINAADINNWNNKQNQLVSGSNIKTINDISLLGSGNLNIGGVNYSAGTGIDITEDVISNTITSYEDLTDLPEIPDSTSQLVNDSNFVSDDELAEVAFTGDYNDLNNLPVIPQNTSDLVNDSNFVTSNELITELATKQENLVSGVNIKTIKNQSIIGAGDLETLDIYNSSETVIGKWINGSNIYRQVFYVGYLPDKDNLFYSTPSMPNDCEVIKIYGTATKANTETFPIPFSWGDVNVIDNYVSIFYDYANKRIFVRTNRYMSAYYGYVIIEYIKTS